MRRDVAWTDTSYQHNVRTTTTSRFSSFCVPFWSRLCVEHKWLPCSCVTTRGRRFVRQRDTAGIACVRRFVTSA